GANALDSGVAGKIERDENGYPVRLPFEVDGAEAPQVVMTRANAGMQGHYPAGEYVVLYDGVGEISVGGDARGGAGRTGAGRAVLSVLPTDDGFTFSIVKSDASDHVRNVRVLTPGAEGTYGDQPFHPMFLERLRPFKVLRFMKWQRIESTPVHSWGDLKGP